MNIREQSTKNKKLNLASSVLGGALGSMLAMGSMGINPNIRLDKDNKVEEDSILLKNKQKKINARKNARKARKVMKRNRK